MCKHMCVQVPSEEREKVESTGSGVEAAVSWLIWVLGMELLPLEKQYMFLIAEFVSPALY